jgi:protein-tyrosine phosphatase
MLDLHVHVLPGIDDGPRTLEDALALAQALADDGIEHIVATPHIYPGVFDNSAARIGETFDAFQAAVTEAGIELTMTWAAEVRICPEILDWIELRRLPMLNGSLVGPSTALIELPDGQIPVGTDKLMGMMLDRGITPLMAHPERNKAVMEQPSRLEALRRLGCKFQVTAGSLLGDFGSRAQTTACKLLDSGWVDVIATDAHNRSSRRPRMGAARQWLVEQYDEALALRLTLTQPTDIAGVSSFSVQAGAQRLVFRDLPAAQPLETTSDWSVGLMLGEIDSAPPYSAASLSSQPEPGVVKNATPQEDWSLIDFRIDAVVSALESASLGHGALDSTDDAPAPTTLTAPVPADAAPQEDWQLPVFATATRSAAPPAEPPRRTPPKPPEPAPPLPAPAAVVRVAPAPAVLQPVPAMAAVVERPAPMPQAPPKPAPVHVAIPAPAAAPVLQVSAPPVPVLTTSPATPRGMRLSDMALNSDVPVVQVQAPVQRPVVVGSGFARQGSLAQAGPQKAAQEATSALPLPVLSRRLPEPVPSTDPPRGLRLSDLAPLPERRQR